MQPLLQLASEVDSDDEIERMQLEQMNRSNQNPTPAAQPAPPPQQQQAPQQHNSPEILHQTCKWIKLYPVYFDSLKSKSDGRRVAKQYAFPDPSSIYIIEAIQKLGLQVVYENEKVWVLI
jgi:hypothetical protein